MGGQRLRTHIFMAMLATAGMACKPAIAPAINLMTDALLIPGGSATAGVSMAVLLVGAGLMPDQFAATKMGFIQGVLALTMGYGRAQGMFLILSYTAPALGIDLLMSSHLRAKFGESVMMSVAGISAVVTGAVLMNSAVFRLEMVPFVLFFLVGVVSGFGGSRLAFWLVGRLRPVLRMQLR